MLIDEATIDIEAGHGGDGKVTFYINRGKPSGGDGGSGGDVYAKINPQLSSLLPYLERKEFHAPKGSTGGSFLKSGRAGDDLTLAFPRGTVLTDLDSGEVFELSPDSPTLLARGGTGGWGNATINRSRNHIFAKANPGRAGGKRRLSVIMKLIADCGLIGFPNAGKSSLLNILTRSQARVADYPFTTLEPNLGVMYGPGGYPRIVLADIPGLIEGASLGKGLGIKFLKHIEKVRLFVHCLSCESTDIAGDYEKVRHELREYNAELMNKPEILLLTKWDLVIDDPARQAEILAAVTSLGLPHLVCSLADDGLVDQLRATILRESAMDVPPPPVEELSAHVESSP